jgi:hypothetical protein
MKQFIDTSGYYDATLEQLVELYGLARNPKMTSDVLQCFYRWVTETSGEGMAANPEDFLIYLRANTTPKFRYNP